MPNPIVANLHKQVHDRQAIYLPPELLEKAKGRGKIFLRFGQRKTAAIIKASRRPGCVYLSAHLMETLKIPFEQRVCFSFKDRELSIGPLVGLMVAGFSPEEGAFPRHPAWIARYLLASRNVPSYFFLFHPQDMDYAAGVINAYFLISNKGKGSWQRHKVPFPDVVYNRVINRIQEQSPSVKLAKSLLIKRNIPFFNPDFFNKWTIYEKISADPRAANFLPETVFNPTLAQIARLLARYPMIYLKPSSGSLGLGIAQLYHLPQKGYFLRYRRGNQNKLFRFKSFTKAMDHFMRHKSSKTYIAQQGIALMTADRRPVDFRVHTNKNAFGQWEVTALAAKLAGRGSVTTHVRSGGQVLSAGEAIRACFPPELEKVILERIHQAAIILSQTIDDHLEGWLGELGFDLGVDQGGQVWMFEANSKPGRQVFVHPSLKESEQITRQKILEYALYLANFTTEEVRP